MLFGCVISVPDGTLIALPMECSNKNYLVIQTDANLQLWPEDYVDEVAVDDAICLGVPWTHYGYHRALAKEHCSVACGFVIPPRAGRDEYFTIPTGHYKVVINADGRVELTKFRDLWSRKSRKKGIEMEVV